MAQGVSYAYATEPHGASTLSAGLADRRTVPLQSPFEQMPAVVSEGPVTPDDVRRVCELHDSLQELRDVYHYCGDVYARRYYGMTIPTILLGITVSALAAGWPECSNPVWNKVVLSVLSAVATMLVAATSLFRFQSKMDVFNSSARQIEGLISRCSFKSKFDVEGHVKRINAQQLISEVERHMTEIRSHTPQVPLEMEVRGRLRHRELAKQKSRFDRELAQEKAPPQDALKRAVPTLPPLFASGQIPRAGQPLAALAAQHQLPRQQQRHPGRAGAPGVPAAMAPAVAGAASVQAARSPDVAGRRLNSSPRDGPLGGASRGREDSAEHQAAAPGLRAASGPTTAARQRPERVAVPSAAEVLASALAGGSAASRS